MSSTSAQASLAKGSPPANPPWGSYFVDPETGRPAVIRLSQVTRRCFVLESSLRYTGETGVDGLPAAALTLHPADLGEGGLTDLASVPFVFRWFVSSYDIHTPAALLHDRLIGPTAIDGVSDAQADRFFRFMLKSLGVRFVRRWMMWTAVAFGTRWRAGGWKRLSLVVWILLAIGGITCGVVGIIQPNWWLLLVGAIAPLPAALLWGRQYGAGLTAAATAIWVLPPTVVGAVGFAIYYLLERIISLVSPSRIAGNEPIRYRNF